MALEKIKKPNVMTVKGRRSSVTNSFVNGILPYIEPTKEQIAEALEVLGMKENNIRCAYCGDPYTEWDHFHPIVEDQRPSGYIHEIYNFIPCCHKCNSSKSGDQWRKWIERKNKKGEWVSPIKKSGCSDSEFKKTYDILEKYDVWSEKNCHKLKPEEFIKIVGIEKWEKHWKAHDLILESMTKAQGISNDIQDMLKENARNKEYDYLKESIERESSDPDVYKRYIRLTEQYFKDKICDIPEIIRKAKECIIEDDQKWFDNKLKFHVK